MIKSFCKQENIAITVAYYEYTTSSDLTTLCSFVLRYYSIKETIVWYGNVYLYIQLLQLLEDLSGFYVYVARLGTKFQCISNSYGIRLVQDDHSTIYSGMLTTTFVQVFCLVFCSNLTLIHYYQTFPLQVFIAENKEVHIK